MPSLLSQSPSATSAASGRSDNSHAESLEVLPARAPPPQPATAGWWRRCDAGGSAAASGATPAQDSSTSGQPHNGPHLTVTPTATPPGQPPPLASAWWRRQAATPSGASSEEVVVEPVVEEQAEAEDEGRFLSPRPASDVAAESDVDLPEPEEPPFAYNPLAVSLSADPQRPSTPGRSSPAPTSALLGVEEGSGQPSQDNAPEREDPDDISEFLESFVTPYEYHPVQLSFGCSGPLSADTQVFRVRNTLGQKIEVRDAAGNLFLTAAGQFKPVGYDFTFYDPMGSHAFSVCTVDLQEQETYEFIGPHGIVIASAMRTRFNPRTEIRVCANTAKCENPVEVLCRSIPQSLLGGRYQVTTPEGHPLGIIRRHLRKGIVTHQTFTVVVGPEVDPYMMVFLAVACNCINNERPKIAWAVILAGMATMAI